MSAAKQGDLQAITDLYRDVNPRLSRYLRAREPQEADDLASETWLVLARQIKTFSGSEKQWWALVFLVARRCLTDHWKRNKRRKTAPVPSEAFTDLPGSTDVETEGLDALQSRDAVDLVLRTLSADQADVILLRVMADLDADSVAEILGKRPGTIRVLQHRALRTLAMSIPDTSAPA